MMAGGDMVVGVVDLRRGDRLLYSSRRCAMGWMVGQKVTDLFLEDKDGRIGYGGQDVVV